ncbi:MAG: hypothetical protein R6W82_08220 [bacterium]
MRSPAAALLIALSLVLSACGGREPAPPDGRHVAIYADLARVAGARGEAAPDSVREAIFRRWDTTQEAYQKVLDTYRADPRRWADFFAAVTETLEARVR